jgi:hypothetical protein
MQPPPPPYPASAAAPQPSHYPASTEPFGAVNPTYGAASPVQAQRRRPSPYLLSPTTYTGAAASAPKQPQEINRYEHNGMVAFFLLPSLFLTLWNHVSSVPLQTFLYFALTIYAIDLANFRDFYLGILWVGAVVMTVVNGGATLFNVADDEAGGANMVLVMMKLLCEGMLFVCLVRKNGAERDP